MQPQIIAWAASTAALVIGMHSQAHAIGSIDEFTIGLEQPVSNGVPGPGAGNLEAPGALDRYFVSIDAGTLVYFDEMSGGCGIVWRCIALDAAQLFNNNAICVGDPGSMLPDARRRLYRRGVQQHLSGHVPMAASACAN